MSKNASVNIVYVCFGERRKKTDVWMGEDSLQLKKLKKAAVAPLYTLHFLIRPIPNAGETVSRVLFWCVSRVCACAQELSYKQLRSNCKDNRACVRVRV